MIADLKSTLAHHFNLTVSLRRAANCEVTAKTCKRSIHDGGKDHNCRQLRMAAGYRCTLNTKTRSAGETVYSAICANRFRSLGLSQVERKKLLDTRVRQSTERRYFAHIVVVILILLAPSVVWVLRDQSVWPWDQAVYGEWTLKTWDAKEAGFMGWMDAWLRVWGGRPPLIVWLGQFFLPFRYLTSSFESAMLLSNIAIAAGTLILIYKVARKYSATWLETLVAVVACGGSTFFVGLTHQYLTELLQCFTTAFMMFVAFRAEQRSVIRTVLLMLIAVSLSFAAKASSAPFVLPFLAYAILILIIMRGRPKPAADERDILLFVAGTAVAAGTSGWYIINWEPTVAHFVEATIGSEALHYGSPVVLSAKLAYWISTLGQALSPITLLSGAICFVIIIGIVMALIRLSSAPVRDWIFVAIEDGTLFALVLAATIILTLLTFSLQINEDKRYALPLIPMVAVLLSWSLSVFGRKILTAVLLYALTVSSVAVNYYALGLFDQDLATMSWNWRLQLDQTDATLLETAVRASCPPQNENETNLFIVDYVNLNGHSANFYAEKDQYTTGYRCYYSIREDDVQTAMDQLKANAPPYIITVASDKQPPPDFTNVFAKDLTLFIARDLRYSLVTELSGYVQIYKKIK